MNLVDQQWLATVDLPNSLLNSELPKGPFNMIPKPVARPNLVRSSVNFKSETAKPTKPASGNPPLPVADSSRISPPVGRYVMSLQQEEEGCRLQVL